MTRRSFETLVNRLEPFAKREPQAYQTAVGALAALGYAYIVFVLLVMLALLGGLIALIVYLASQSPSSGTIFAFKLGVPVGLGLIGVIGSIVGAFRVHISPPDGIPLARSEAPRLFVMLDEICSGLRAPKFHHVLMTGDFNAGVKQVPRLGLLGGQTNYLVLGLPLMQALSPDQFRAVIAHEVGHLSRSHSRFSGKMYYLRQTWQQILTQMQRERHRSAWVFTSFFRWYAPYFYAYTFVLARSNEYVADRCSAEVVGAQTAAEALVASEVQGRRLGNEFWPQLFKTAQQQAEPPASPFSLMQQALQSSGSEHAEEWLEDAFSERTGFGDTHPSLMDRVSALGFRATPGGPLDLPKPPLPVPPPPAETAAARYLGPAAARYVQRFDSAWRNEVGPKWREEHVKAQHDERHLREIQAQAAQMNLSEKDWWEMVELTARFDGPAAALPLLQQMLAKSPNNAKARYVFGRLLIDEGDLRGIPHLEQGTADDPERAAAGYDAASWLLRRQGKAREAAKFRERAKEARDQWTRAQEERESLTSNDRFQPHGLPPEDIQRLRGQFLSHPGVGAAYLVRKTLRHLPERPLYVLGIQPVPGRRAPGEEFQTMRRLAQSLHMPGETRLLLLPQEKAVGKVIRQSPGAMIYRKP